MCDEGCEECENLCYRSWNGTGTPLRTPAYPRPPGPWVPLLGGLSPWGQQDVNNFLWKDCCLVTAPDSGQTVRCRDFHSGWFAVCWNGRSNRDWRWGSSSGRSTGIWMRSENNGCPVQFGAVSRTAVARPSLIFLSTRGRRTTGGWIRQVHLLQLWRNASTARAPGSRYLERYLVTLWFILGAKRSTSGE